MLCGVVGSCQAHLALPGWAVGAGGITGEFFQASVRGGD